MNTKPRIAILKWEEGLVPEGLMQLEEMPGNSTNHDSYKLFPVKFIPIEGACVDTIITHPSQVILDRMVEVSNNLIENEGIEAIATSCGFNAIFQQELAKKVDAPVFTSSLLQVPFVQSIIGIDNTVGVITANKSSLTEEHLTACGITADMHVKVFGLEAAKEWSKIFDKPNERFDMDAVADEIVGVAMQAVGENPDIRAIVLECTDLPPYSERISRELNMPVFDFISMIGHVAVALKEIRVF